MRISVLGLPAPGKLSRKREDRERYAEAAAPQSIEEYLKDARRDLRRAKADVEWLEALLARRQREVAKGTWPARRGDND